MAKTKRAESRCRYLVRKIATQKGWDVRHPQKGGQFLEEQEIEDYFNDSGLGKTKPDFLVCKNFQPLIVVEAKNEKNKIDNAINEAIDYAEAINDYGKYTVNIAVGVAGEEDNGYLFKTKIYDGNEWLNLSARGFILTSFPSVSEIENAIITNNGTTEVSIPNVSEYITTAIELSSILRSAKIEPSLRPKVLGAVITAMYQGEIDLTEGKELESINSLVSDAIYSTDHFEDKKKKQLIETLRMAEADYSRLASKMGRIIFILKTLNIKSILQTDTDFHARQATCDHQESFDRMLSTYKEMGIPYNVIRESIYGFDTNPTVWALAALNMFFRGDGKSNIENASCFDENSKKAVAGRFKKALLNPPFSQEEEPERDFIDIAMKALQTLGLMAVVVKSGIFADDDNSLWRNSFLKEHTLLGMISLPGDLFYPTAVDTTIMIAQAKRPQESSDNVFMAKIWNDGYKKLKGKRVETTGSQLNEVLDNFKKYRAGEEISTKLATIISANEIMKEGAEFCPEQYLPQPDFPTETKEAYKLDVVKSILRTAVSIDEIADEVLPTFPNFTDLPTMPYGKEDAIESYFYVNGGKSSGESNYNEGSCPYVSSGDPLNSIIRLVSDVEGEVFENGAITVTCFGRASIQPWRFMARGNGGSAVRVLIPKYRMSFSELVWFAAQINMQRWRFFYGRMAIAKRLKKIRLVAPESPIKDDDNKSISEKIAELSKKMADILIE